MKYSLMLFFICVTGAVSYGQIPSQTVPAFQFYRFDKTVFTNKDLSKDKQLFFVFFDTDCEHCQKAVTYVGEHYSAFKDVSVYLLTMDDKDKTDRFMGKYGVKLKDKKNVTLLNDKNAEFIYKFKPRKYPSMFLYSKEKQLIAYEDNEESIFRFVNAISSNPK